MKTALRIAGFAVLLLWAASAATAVTVYDMRIVGDENRTRLVVDLDDEPRFGILRLVDPMRLVIDLADVSFKQSEPAGDARGIVTGFRFGLIAPGRGRIVLDLGQPADLAQTFVLPAAGDQPARVVFDLVPGTREAYVKAAADDRDALAVSLPAEPEVMANKADARPVVVIDPGHGGFDSGAVGRGGLLEKNATLAFSKTLYETLVARGKVQPVLTRDGDEFLTLAQRVGVARNNQAALFVSVHADSVAEDYVRGATVYTLSEEASDSIAAALAARENRSDILAGLAIEDQPVEVADILLDLTRRETRNLSVRLARSLIAEMQTAFKLNKSPLRRASFKVLTAPDVPSVLLELGYLSNKLDEGLLRSDEWRRRSAGAVAEAIEAHTASGPRLQSRR